MALSERHLRLLEARGLDPELLDRFGVATSDKLGGDCVVIPFVRCGTVVNNKYRTIAGPKRFLQDTGAVKTFWNVDVIADQTLADRPLIITEGEFDAMIAIQCGFVRTVSVPDGAPAQAIGDGDTAKYTFLDSAPQALKDVREIILATDGDGPGINLMNDLALRLGRARCKWVRYPRDCKDLNDAFMRYDQRGVTETIARAQWMHVAGVYRMSELPPFNEPLIYPTGIATMDAHYNIRLGDFVVVTGIPSHGKTSFINEICARKAIDGWKVAFASFEQMPQTDHRRSLRTFFNRKLVRDQMPDEIAEADRWIEDQFVFIVPDEDEDATLEWLLERCAAAVIQHRARIIAIDPWNELDHMRPKDMSLTEYTGFAIKRFKRFARKFGVHLIVAAHPTKQSRDKDGCLQPPGLYDISDSAHWYNKCDVGIIVHRTDETRTMLRVGKVRYRDKIGVEGDVYGHFVPETQRYSIDEQPPEARQ